MVTKMLGIRVSLNFAEKVRVYLAITKKGMSLQSYILGLIKKDMKIK